MRLPYILMAAISTLAVHQVPATAAVGSHAALPGQSRLLRGNDIAEGDQEERGFTDVVDQVMAKILFSKLLKSPSFSALEKVDDLARLRKVSKSADDHLTSVFRSADDAKMRPDDLATHLKTFDELDNNFVGMAVAKYTDYLRGLHKLD